MTKIEIITNLDRILTTEILDKFYSISLTDYSCINKNNEYSRAAVRIQADYTSDLVFNLNKLLNIDEQSQGHIPKDADDSRWIVGNSGYIHLSTDINITPKEVDGKSDFELSRTIKLDITLA